MNGSGDERCFCRSHFYCLFFSLSLSLFICFLVFKLIPTLRRICMHIRTYVLSDFMVLRAFNTILPRCRGQTTRCEKRTVRRTWIYGRIGLLSFSLDHLRYLQHHHACISASNASHGRSGNTPTHTEGGVVRKKAWGLSGWARSSPSEG